MSFARGTIVRVVAVVPVFAPPDDLAPRLRALAGQVDALVTVLDGEGSLGESDDYTVIRHEHNRGIATALNTGVEWARANGATHVVTVDQDTDLPPDYVGVALSEFASATLTRVGVVVPDAFDGVHAVPAATSAEGVKLVTEALQTGMLISVECLEDAGGFDASLAIDVVDIEFCHRARARGWAIAIARGTDVQHRLGDEVQMRPFGIPWRRNGTIRTYQWHRPFRQYYIVRNNWIVTARFRSGDEEWAAQTRRRVAHEARRISVVGPHGLRHALASTVGWIHGISGRSGPIPRWLASIVAVRR